MPDVSPLDDKICPRCGEPYAWLERRLRGDRVYLYAVHEHVKNGVRRRRRCYLGPEEVGQGPEEVRAWEGPEAEEVLSEGEEEPKAAGRKVPGEGEEGIEPAALTPLTAPTAVGGPGPYEDEFRELVRWARSQGLTPCDVKRLLGMRSPSCEEEGKGEEAMPRREEEDDLLAEAERMMRVKVQMDLLRGMGILRRVEGRSGSATLDAPEILMLMSAAGGRDEVNLRGMLPYMVVTKALGGEKSSDWKDLTAALVSLARRKQEFDPLALLDLMEEAERGAREEERERWRALAEALRRRRSPEEDFGLDEEVGRLVGERLRAALAAEEPHGAEAPEGRPTEAGGEVGRPRLLQVLR
ncbi:MAG: hypothetical protein RXS42_09270 [Nitrososphaeria archaeon]